MRLENVGRKKSKLKLLKGALKQQPDLCRAADDREEHAVEVEVPEVSRDLHSIEEEGDDWNSQVKSNSNVVALLHVGNVDAGNDQGAATSRPKGHNKNIINFKWLKELITFITQ